MDQEPLRRFLLVIFLIYSYHHNNRFITINCGFSTYNLPYLVVFPSGCVSEQAAAKALGYTQVSWDDESQNERQPSFAAKSWSQLTVQEKALLEILGYTAKTWDNVSGKEEQPASASKFWSDLIVCGENLLITRLLVAPPALCETRP